MGGMGNLPKAASLREGSGGLHEGDNVARGAVETGIAEPPDRVGHAGVVLFALGLGLGLLLVQRDEFVFEALALSAEALCSAQEG